MRNKFYSHINHFSNTKSVSRLSLIMFYSDSITNVRGIMARYIRASVHKDKRSMYDDLTVEEYEKADYMRVGGVHEGDCGDDEHPGRVWLEVFSKFK